MMKFEDISRHPGAAIAVWVAVVLIGALLFLQASVTSIGFVYGNV